MVEFEGAATGRRAVDAASYAECTRSTNDYLHWKLFCISMTFGVVLTLDLNASGMAELLGDAKLREQLATK